MNDQEMRIAIGEFLGWRKCPNTSPCNRWHSPDNLRYEALPPDFLNDLNAMHEAENVLTFTQWVDYIENLKRVVGCYSNTYQSVRAKVHSTASQRAEAFLKTISELK